jgi:hypothetical protein
MSTRAQRLDALVAHYEPDRQLGHVELSADDRFALASANESQWMITTHATFADACSCASDEVLDGWDPHAVFDLDTGELINLHIASPVVTRSEDQGVLVNPVEPCKHCGSPASAHDEVDQRCPDE